MSRCNICNTETNTTYTVGKTEMCETCYKQHNLNNLMVKASKLKEAADLKHWSKRDMSELFWIHLGIYVKMPNKDSLKYMVMCNNWAVHDDKGLANSFSHALKWADISLYAEQQKWRNK